MTQPDQQKLRILIVLLMVLGVTLFIGYRMNRTPDPAVVQAEAPKAATPAPRQTDARIRLDLLKKEASDGDLGKKNLFQYGPPPAPPAPPASRGAQNQTPGKLNPNPGSLATNIPSVPPAPPPPPPIPLKYIGFAYVEPNSQNLIAALTDDTQHHFNAVEGDIFMGRYRVGRVTATSVDVEDLQSNRRQTLPLVKQ